MKITKPFFFLLRNLRQAIVVFTFVFISACSQNDDAEEKKAKYEAYQFSELQLMVDEGQYNDAAEVLNYYRDAGTASDDHLALLTRIYIEQGDGLAAEIMIDRLEGRGLSLEQIAFRKAQALVLQNKTDEAYDLLMDTQVSDEDQFGTFLLLGDIAMSENDLDQAEQFYTSAVNKNSENFKGHLAFAALSLRQGDATKAKQSIDTAVQYNSEDTLVSYTQGMVARSMNDMSAAIEYFVKAIDINEFNMLARVELVSTYLEQQNIEAAQVAIDEIYLRSPNNALANYFEALILANEGRFDEAENLLLRTGSLPQSYPPSARAHGLVTYQLGKYITAIPHLRLALQFFPYDNRIRLALSDSYLRQGQARQTLALLEPLIAQKPSIPALIQAARASTSIGDVKTARRYFEQAIELTKGDVESDQEALQALKESLAYARYSDNDLTGAMQVLDLVYAETLDIDALVKQANLLLLSGDASGAEEVLLRIEEAAPGSPVAANLKGTILNSQSRFAEAVASYDKAIEQNSKYQSAIKNRALSYIMMKDFSAARRDLETVIALSPNDPQIIAMYGRALLETGDAELALPHLEQSVKNRPNSPVVAADYAEALADAGYYSSALTQARRARTLAPKNDDFIAYLEERSAEWELAKSENEASQQAARQEEFAEIDAKRAEQKELREALTADSIVGEGDDENEKVLAELRALGEANRKADEEERRAKEARLAEEERLKEESGVVEPVVSEAELAERARAEVERNNILKRNRMFGEWLAGELGLGAEEIEPYIQNVIVADESEPGNTDIVRKALLDLEKAGKGMTIQAIEKRLAEIAVQVAAANDAG